MLCFTLSFHHFLMFQVPLNNLTLQQICGTDYLYLFLAFFCLQLFLLYLSPLPRPFSPTCERKHAVNFPQH